MLVPEVLQTYSKGDLVKFLQNKNTTFSNYATISKFALLLFLQTKDVFYKKGSLARFI